MLEYIEHNGQGSGALFWRNASARLIEPVPSILGYGKKNTTALSHVDSSPQSSKEKESNKLVTYVLRIYCLIPLSVFHKTPLRILGLEVPERCICSDTPEQHTRITLWLS
jgi:hypothetical protein